MILFICHPEGISYVCRPLMYFSTFALEKSFLFLSDIILSQIHLLLANIWAKQLANSYHFSEQTQLHILYELHACCFKVPLCLRCRKNIYKFCCCANYYLKF